MKNEILATIAQGTLRGKEEEGMMTFYRIPYGTNTGRFREVGAAPRQLHSDIERKSD